MAEAGPSRKNKPVYGATAMSLRCPQHPDAHLIEDYHAGDMICPDCGLVVGDR